MINYQRLYEHRFRGISHQKRIQIWREISLFIYEMMGKPDRILDPAAGFEEFMRSIPANDRWTVDEISYHPSPPADNIKRLVADIFTVELPDDYFEAVFVSNFLEHLATQNQVATFLQKIYRCIKPGGQIVIMGPNFKYCVREYFDCADHTLPLTHIALEEHLYAANFAIEKLFPRFLPYSFRGNLPVSAPLVRLYLKSPWAWKFLGKQFLIQGRKT
jgi:SAM-dependent methyltransferase